MPSYTELDEFVPTSMTTSERDSIWESPPNYLTIFNSTIGLYQVFIEGNWKSLPAYVKMAATAAPTVNDDSNDGYNIGDRWLDVTNDNEFVCLDDTVGAAVWRTTTIFEDSYNGMFLEPFTFVVTEAGGVITGTLDKNPSGDMTERFSDGYSTATSGISIALTAGSDTAPTLNYVYILQSNKGVLAKSTTGWPAAEHNKIAQVILQTAATTQTEGGALVNQFWNDFTKGPNGQGHHLHGWERLRHEHSAYKEGGAITWTITTNVGTPDNVDVAVTAAKVYQLHLQDFEAKDTAGADNAHVVNDSVSPYTEITDFADLLTDSAGGSMSGRYFNLVLWGSISSGSEKEHLFVNLPGGSYNKQGDAIADVSGFTVYDIPSDFRGKAFLISRITLRHQAASGGTWTNIQAISLRGQVPNIVAGGGTAAITTEFADNQHRIFSAGDPTKQVAHDVGSVSPSTTRTITMPDNDVTLLDAAQPEAITGLWNFIASGLGGATDYDLTVGDVATPDYGVIRIGNASLGRTSHNAAALDLDGAMIFRNMGGPVTGQIEFVWTESAGGGLIRFALPKSGAGNATYSPRSMLIAGPAVNDDDIVTVGYWQTNNSIFDNLACDTGGDGADLGVQNDLEVEGDIFTDSIKESTPGAGVTIDADIDLNGNNIDNGGVIFLKEQAEADADVAGSGQLWVNTATPNELFFTGDDGIDQPLTVPKRSIIIRASGLIPNITDPCADAVQAETGTGGKNYVTRAFAANEQGSMDMLLPPNYDGGTVTFIAIWLSPTGSSAGDTVIWGLRGSSSQNGDLIGEAQGTQVTVTDTVLTGAGRVHISAESAAVTIAGSPSGGDPIIWELERTGGTMAEEAELWKLYIRYGTNNASDE